MNAETFSNLAARLLRLPTAPYHEQAVRVEAERICAENNLCCSRDEFGNLIVRLRTVSERRPLVLAAHLDHPGFEIISPPSPRVWLARFRGGVPDPYFRLGIPLRLVPGNTPARLGPRKGQAERTFELHASAAPSAVPLFAVWDLEPFAVRNQRIYARGCDDVVGCACVLATLLELKRRRTSANVLGVLSRAEEVGFHGALALAQAGGIPPNSLLVSLETSRELPGARMGQGMILRVGDRSSIFDSAATRFLGEVAAGLAAGHRQFRFQRALMGGGTCEATAYQEFGFQSTAVCIALGNYHNCGPRNRIQAEYVSLADACGMVDFLVETAAQMPRYRELTARLPARLRKLLREARSALRRTAGVE